MNSNSIAGVLGLWMMLQLAVTIALLLGGIYALFCLGRAASGLDRMASALEEWLARQHASTPALPDNSASDTSASNSVLSFSQRIHSAPIAPSAPTVQAEVFTPAAPPNSPANAPEYSRPDESVSL